VRLAAGRATAPYGLGLDPQQRSDLGLDADIDLAPGVGADEHQSFHRKPPVEDVPEPNMAIR
jgi:hypothetical protein